jgi:hypothetical protein
VIVLDLLTPAAKSFGLIGETDQLSAEQGATGVRKLNRMMAELAEDGIDLGYNPKANTATTLELPLGHVAGIEAMVAVRWCGDYGLPVPPAVLETARDSHNRLLGQAIRAQIERAVSSTLPAGEGQRGGYDITRGY